MGAGGQAHQCLQGPWVIRCPPNSLLGFLRPHTSPGGSSSKRMDPEVACLGLCRCETHRPLQCIWAHPLASVFNRGGEREGISSGNGPGFERDGWGCWPHRHHCLAQKEGRSPRSTANPRTTGTHRLECRRHARHCARVEDTLTHGHTAVLMGFIHQCEREAISE